eukprot:scaffold22134_cov112-Isochrysis_galbana.AAC.1
MGRRGVVRGHARKRVKPSLRKLKIACVASSKGGLTPGQKTLLGFGLQCCQISQALAQAE